MSTLCVLDNLGNTSIRLCSYFKTQITIKCQGLDKIYLSFAHMISTPVCSRVAASAKLSLLLI